MTHTFEIEEAQRQLVLCALAHLSLLRPGWDYALGETAEAFKGRSMFEDMKRLNADRTPPQDLWPRPKEA